VCDTAPFPPRSTWEWLVEAALTEDLGPGDATTIALVPADLEGQARIVALEQLVPSGLELARAVFEEFDVELEAEIADGEDCEAGQPLARLVGPARGILTAERTALNFLQHLSGIATQTRRFCVAVRGHRTAIVDTRKTTPGWRSLEKYAVSCGGGINHRMGLYDGILIKDNHIAVAGSAGAAVKKARDRAPAGLRIQCEVESVDQAREAIEAGVDMLLIDNQGLEVTADIVALAAGRVPLEASGGITLDNVVEVAAAGVDRISIGALTHSAAAVDISLEWLSTSSS